MDEFYFFYGTLCHPPLLAAVLGRDANSVPARLPDHSVRYATDPHGHEVIFPTLVKEPGEGAPGVVVRVAPSEVERLNFYEAGYRTGTVTAELAGGERVAARVFLSLPGHFQPGAPWSRAAWQEQWADIATLAAQEYMTLLGQIPQALASARFPMILVRAASRLRAARQAPGPARLRHRPQPGDVTLVSLKTPYAKFFAVEDYELRHRKFGGEITDPLTRAVFISGDATVLLPYDPLRDRVLLIEQFRPGPFARGDLNPWSIEAVAGRVDAGETPAQAALREAGEEAGVHIDRLVPAPNFYPSPGAKSEYLYCFVGIADLPEGAARPGGLEEEGEDIRPHLVSFDELMELIDSGEAENGPLIVLALWLARMRPRFRAEAGIAD